VYAYLVSKYFKGFFRFDGDADHPVGTAKSEKHGVVGALVYVILRGQKMELRNQMSVEL
jgi:hypothetical protein